MDTDSSVRLLHRRLNLCAFSNLMLDIGSSPEKISNAILREEAKGKSGEDHAGVNNKAELGKREQRTWWICGGVGKGKGKGIPGQRQ